MTDASKLVSYGEHIAEVYDDWYGVQDTESAVEFLCSFAKGWNALELGIGTGRVALLTEEAQINEGNRGNGPGCGNGRDEAGSTARAAGSDKRRRRSGACVGIHLG
jgi:hypothetical protein